MARISYEKIVYDFLTNLDERSKDIVAKRFGFDQEPFTLERIGQDYDLTRERVRQIVEDSLSEMRERIVQHQVRPSLFEAFDYFVKTLNDAGGLKREDLLLRSLGDARSYAYILFLLELGDQFIKHRETDEIHDYWTIEKELIERVSATLKALLLHLDRAKQVVEFEELEERARQQQAFKNLLSVLEVSKHVMQTHDGKWGLKRWPHVYPKTIRDKAYVVMKKEGKPLHFRQLAALIDAFQKKFSVLKQKKILPQTVHNELIKDKRFVLVGRGTYALAEWGYRAGTVKDVISALLKGAKKLNRQEIVEQTLAQRQVKPSTVLLNLQDRSLFAKDEAGRYYRK